MSCRSKKKKKNVLKIDKGVIKTVDQMTPREQRKARKIWKKKARKREKRLALQNVTNIPVLYKGHGKKLSNRTKNNHTLYGNVRQHRTIK